MINEYDARQIAEQFYITFSDNKRSYAHLFYLSGAEKFPIAFKPLLLRELEQIKQHLLMHNNAHVVIAHLQDVLNLIEYVECVLPDEKPSPILSLRALLYVVLVLIVLANILVYFYL